MAVHSEPIETGKEVDLNTDVIVGLLTLLGIVYLAWTQTEVRGAEVSSSRAEAVEFSSEAVMHITSSLIQAIETLAGRDKLIVELRVRIEQLEERSRLRGEIIADLERKIEQLEASHQALALQRDELLEQVGSVTIEELPE